MITITIATDNAAFELPGGGQEVARILRLLADTYALRDEYDFRELSLRDLNGNLVGSAIYKKPRKRR